MNLTDRTFVPYQDDYGLAMLADAPSFTQKIAGGISRRLSRMVPFRPFKLRLERPVVAFTFDDFPCSAADTAAPILEDAGMRGTFYHASGLAGRSENGQKIAGPDSATSLFSRGHEIGAHTHMHIDVHRNSNHRICDDIERNKRAIAQMTGGRVPTSFAYPFGRLDIRSKFLLRHEFAGLRGIQPGINAGIIDLAHLKAQELYDSSSTLESVNRMLDEMERTCGWLIFYTHDVKQNPSTIGSSPAYFRAVVDLVHRRRLTVETVAETLARIGA